MNQKNFFILYLILFISAISFFPYKKYNTLFAFRIDRFITNNFLGNDAYLYSIPKTKPITYSTSSDLCITPLFGAKEVFFDINLFSIRKSGCAATIIIITDNSTVFSENVKKLIPASEVYVCEKSNKIVGFIGLSENYIAGIFVASNFQSYGIGKRLLDYAKGLKPELYLHVYQKNIRAVKFYQRENFVIESETVDGTGEKEFLMKTL